jgi:multicomponent Na+:H+ antiporter subunit D
MVVPLFLTALISIFLGLYPDTFMGFIKAMAQF